MPPAAPPAPAERFARLIDGLCRAVAARSFRGGLAGPLIILIWSRLRRLGVRFARLAARIEAGALPVARRRPTASRPARPAPPRLPRGFAWLVRLVPQASAYGSQLQHLLAEPEMAALLDRRAADGPNPAPALPDAGGASPARPPTAAARKRAGGSLPSRRPRPAARTDPARPARLPPANSGVSTRRPARPDRSVQGTNP